MTIEERIRMSAHRIADEVDPPVLDIALVRRRAHADRRRRVGIVAVVVATVAVCVLVPRLLGSPSTAPDPVDRPPGPDDSSPARVVRSVPVWADAEGLHMGGRVLNLALDSQSSSCGFVPQCSAFTSLALVDGGAVYGDRKSHRVWYQPSKGRARLIGEGSRVGPAGDPDGTTAAWFDGSDLVMFDTATGRELARTYQPGALPSPQRENAHGNRILEVSSEGVTWEAAVGPVRFDRLSTHTSRVPNTAAGKQGDVHQGWVASENSSGVTEVISPAGDTTVKLEPGQLSGPLRFNSDGRYVAGITTNDAYNAVVADTRTGEVLIPSRNDVYPWIGWGYGDILMVIQDYEGTNDGNPFDKSQLLACDVSELSCERLKYKGVITLPNN